MIYVVAFTGLTEKEMWGVVRVHGFCWCLTPELAMEEVDKQIRDKMTYSVHEVELPAELDELVQSRSKNELIQLEVTRYLVETEAEWNRLHTPINPDRQVIITTDDEEEPF